MIFATLGPAGSNHELVLNQYLVLRGLADAQQQLFGDFRAAFEALLAGEADYVLQVTAHPAHADCVGHYMHRAFPVDSFIAPSKPLAILTRNGIKRPVSLGLQPATRYYTDLSAWAHQTEEPTIVRVAEGLLEGRYDSGITALDVVDQHPDQLHVDRLLGPALDTWVLFGRHKIDNHFLLWPEAPVMQQFRAPRNSGDVGQG